MNDTTRGFGAYTLESIFMQTADGLVYRAQHTATGVKVLVSIPHMPEDQDDIGKFRDRFLASALRAQPLRHPGILEMREVGVDEATGMPFIAYEAVDGRDLRELTGHGRRLTDADIALVGAAVTEALQHAHDAGFVHGSISPDAIVFGEGDVVKLVGFGVDSAAKSPTGMRGYAPGTGAYSSPEQIIGGTVDGRSDLFSLGIVLFEAVTGQHPFMAVPPRDTRDRIVADEASLPSKIRPETPGGFNSILFKLLQKDPGKRPASAAEAAQSLRALHARLLQPPPAPVAPAVAARPQAATRGRGRTLALLAAGGGVLVLAAVIVAVVSMRPTPLQRQAAPALPAPAESRELSAALADVEAALAAGDFAKADRQLAEVRRLDPLNARGLEQAQRSRALRDDKVRRLYDEGIALGRSQRWQDAERRFLDVLAIDPDNVDAKDQIEAIHEVSKSPQRQDVEIAAARPALPARAAPTTVPSRLLRLFFSSPLPSGDLALTLDRQAFATLPFDFSVGGGAGIVDKTFEMPHGRHQILVTLHNQQGLTLGDQALVLDFQPGHTFQVTVEMSSPRAVPRFTAKEVR